jgi:hypothetical protein
MSGVILSSIRGCAFVDAEELALSDNKRNEEFETAYECLEQQAPDRVARMLRWFRNPKARWIRIPLGIIFVILSFLWFLPVVGIELLPLGLLLLAFDVPFLQKPIGRALLWAEQKWVAIRARWRGKS